MVLQVVLLGEIHDAGDGTQSESSIGQKYQRLMQAGQATGESRRGGAHVERGHQRKNPNGQQDGRGKCTEKPEARPGADQKIRRHNSPTQKSRCFVEVVYWASLQ